MAPIFLNFEHLEGAAEQVDHGLDRLGDSFADLGGGFVKLVDAATDELKIKLSEDSPALAFKHAENVVAHDFLKVGLDFLKVDVPLHKFDDGIVKLTDEFLKITPSTEGGNPLAAEFLKYEGDLKLTGLDFLQLAADLKSGAPTETLSLDFSKLQFDYKEQGADAVSIGETFQKISIQIDSFPFADEFHKFGDDFVKLGNDSLTTAVDWNKLSRDLAPTTDSPETLLLDQVVAQHPEDFLSLVVDFHKLNTDFTGLGTDAHKIAEAIEPPESRSFKFSG
jgi:hypothetical protein